MSANVEIVRRLFDLYERGEFEECARHIHPEAVMRPLSAGGTEFHGPGGVSEFVSGNRKRGRQLEARAFRFLERDDHVVALGGLMIREGSKIEDSSGIGWVFQIRDGLVLRIEAFTSAAKALEAAGIEEWRPWKRPEATASA